MAKLTFLGHSAFSLVTGGHTIIFDPFLTGNPHATTSPEEVDCDFVVLTHGHGDHIGDAVDICKSTGATVIANFEVSRWCQKQGLKAHGMQIGGAHDFPFGRVKLTIAHHGSGYDSGDGMIYMGNPAGILITIEDKTIYHAGDTGLFYDMKLIGEMNDIAVALLPIGDNFTMGIDDAVKATEFLDPDIAVPMHFNTFDVIKANPQEFAKKVAGIGKQAQVLEIGESLEL